MSDDQSKYAMRGVSASKSEVHQAIKNLDKGLFPSAFCKILPDIVGGDEEYCNIMHADTAGTKTSLAYMYWRETGDLSVWEGIAQDSIVMNLDDMACVGCLDNIVISSTIGRNKHKITGEVLGTLINSGNDFFDMLAKMGCGVTLAGGETADVGDIVRTVDVGYTTFARMHRKDVLVNDIQPGDVIVGLSSSGQATYENEYNGGMGSNGLTSARHDVLSKVYKTKYPESFDPATPDQVVYTGPHNLLDEIDIPGGKTTIGKLLLSPTRTYIPVLNEILKTHKSHINGLIHCTGGAQTKVLKFVKGRHIIKDNLLEIPTLFNLIQSASGTEWKEMYQVFNMGHRLEFYLPKQYAEDIIRISSDFNIDAQIIGHVEGGEGQKLTIKSPKGTFEYSEG